MADDAAAPARPALMRAPQPARCARPTAKSRNTRTASEGAADVLEFGQHQKPVQIVTLHEWPPVTDLY
ncbi:hypothetical protein ACFYXQ_23570 [Nocardia jiangxiensis]|uniref:Uncharacterized protein n=1 Tax=Nocardia jiangxiensis TaxID=282685 RepID=A0ABW6S397_9NOCA